MLILDMLACFRDGEDRLRNNVVSTPKIANAAFVDNEWRFIGQAERELSLSDIEAGRKIFSTDLVNYGEPGS
ncbi:hypothetical protein [Shinella sp.]|uniref:hypothetical protein n=1 Tax=Shinella sp. TaxID=1870904 RepID=UPI003F6FA647